jgi:hypothetical protein
VTLLHLTKKKTKRNVGIFICYAKKAKRTNVITVPGYRLLWTGLGAQLACDVPFSAICWTTLEPVSIVFSFFALIIV